MSGMNFLLPDVTGEGGQLSGRVEQGPDGLEIYLDGYGDACSYAGSCVYLEFYEGVPRVVIWADINQEDPTHVIELDMAAESRRATLPEE